MIVEPADTAVTAMDAVVWPAATVTGDCTVATAGLLLVNTIVAPPAGAGPSSVTAPAMVLPAATLADPSVTFERALLEGAAGELLLQ